MDGRLTDNFDGVAAKKLSAVEAIGEGRSNQHELNGIRPIINMLGSDRKTFACHYIFFDDSPDGYNFVDERLTITLYDARANQPKRSAEYRLVYPAKSEVMKCAKEGDFCFIARTKAGDLMVAIAPLGSAAANSLDRLFGTDLRAESESGQVGGQFGLFDLDSADDSNLDLDDAELLMNLGVTPRSSNAGQLPRMIAAFGGLRWPTAAGFGAFARSATTTDDPRGDPDQVLFDWFSTANDLFFLYERHLLQPVLDGELIADGHVNIETFFRLAASFKNTRFSRAGKTFESHVEALLDAVGIRYDNQAEVDNSKPDFILPSEALYSNPTFPVELLTILAAKTSAKERWRQVTSEAKRVPQKHLITMDKKLNAKSLNDMKGHQVKPVLPSPVQHLYSVELQAQMMSVADFIELARTRQARTDSFASTD